MIKSFNPVVLFNKKQVRQSQNSFEIKASVLIILGFADFKNIKYSPWGFNIFVLLILKLYCTILRIACSITVTKSLYLQLKEATTYNIVDGKIGK